MSKRLESGFVVAVAALTVVTTATVIHDGNSGKPDELSKWVSSAIRQAAFMVNKWDGRSAAHAQDIPVTAPTAGPTGTPSSTPSSQGSADGPTKGRAEEPSSTTSEQISKQDSKAATALTGGWTQQDIAQLQSIGSDLVGSMSQQDWTNLEQILTTDNLSHAQTAITGLLDTHLSAQDREWLSAHFTGDQAFTPNDIALLQQTVQELQNTLTPDEKSLLSDTLSSYFQTQQTP